MGELRKLTAEDIYQQFHLPRIAAKQIEDANKSMNDPNSTMMQLLQKNMRKKNKIAEKSKKRHSLKNVAGV